MATACALDDGGWLAVRAALEPLMEVTAHGPEQLARLAWHIGNRHLPAQIERDRILIRDDAVIADMLLGLGAHVHRIEAPFSPEGGAYDGHMPGYAHDPDGKPHSHRDHAHGHTITIEAAHASQSSTIDRRFAPARDEVRFSMAQRNIPHPERAAGAVEPHRARPQGDRDAHGFCPH